ncbi:DUF1330 domain-containing protein [Zavarzinia compransoris]|uniref:DUF1330 domain-containing protein n=1 Tax=Zavarzinia marina TaxID=2911065 RepID=UPI001F308EF5|nr:DUF1330 domain-containing protein [Zavarzinia marina]MCF4165578.1 DUF1330 domain-containing protein [Zavarzinia marina]
MTVYAIAQIRIHDRPTYDRYAARFMAVLQRHGGRLLAADEAPLVVEGEWTADKLVLIAFADRTAFETWAGSPDYVEISRDRLAATTGTVILASGIGG